VYIYLFFVYLPTLSTVPNCEICILMNQSKTTMQDETFVDIRKRQRQQQHRPPPLISLALLPSVTTDTNEYNPQSSLSHEDNDDNRKHRCRTINNDFQTGSKVGDNDWYDEVYCSEMMNINPDGVYHDDIVRSSWMKTSLEWVSFQTAFNATKPKTSSDDHDLLLEEIRCLLKQLSVIKKRLSPAAEQYSALYNECCINSTDNQHDNKRYYGYSSSNKTNASTVFNISRRDCNPYESLTERNCRNNLRKRQRHKKHGWCNFANNTFNNNCIGCLFLNRAAIKLANIDAIIGFQLTKVIYDQNNLSSSSPDYCYRNGKQNPNSTFTFVDLCSAPGGFSEYLLWRIQYDQQRQHDGIGKISQIYGFAMSLVGTNEQGTGTPWKLNDIVLENNERRRNTKKQQHFTSSIHYEICTGADGTGDIYNWDNVRHLQSMITDRMNEKSCMNRQQHPNSGKVQLVLADGGFDAQRDNDNQEEMTQKIIVCQVGAALELLQTGGTLIIKMFGFQTLVVRTVLRYLYTSFQHITAIKPISSRPASAERYLVATGFYGHDSSIPDWDGPKWCSEMFLCSNNMIHRIINTVYAGHMPPDNDRNKDWIEPIFAPLYEYLDTFDRNMLTLNLKACFAILSNIEYTSKMLQEENTYPFTSNEDKDEWEGDDQNDIEMDYDDKARRDKRKRYDFIARYKTSWRLN
jgi:cap1 methyltransferase